MIEAAVSLGCGRLWRLQMRQVVEIADAAEKKGGDEKKGGRGEELAVKKGNE